MGTIRNVATHAAGLGAVLLLLGATALPAQAADVVTVHRLSAALANEAVGEAVASCAKQGYRVSAALLNPDGLIQASLRGDGAAANTPEAAEDKAYTAVTLAPNRNEESSREVAARVLPNPAAAALGKLSRVIFAAGALTIKAGNEVIGAIGVGGAPGGDLDEACAKAGIDKIRDRLK